MATTRMIMKTFKIWADIEEYDDETDEYTELELDFAVLLGEFSNLEDAKRHAWFLEELAPRFEEKER